ncbi:MAG: dihydroneopterin aldolase [Alphaproteobacteria bacterium]|nr:dihydroneopterin aldolase [Alphaproteobacteria bacterium]
MPITSSKLFLQDFTVKANIGIHDSEKLEPQRLLISIELEVDQPDYPAPDEITSVLDYDFLRREILGLVGGRHLNLQETLCREIIEVLASQALVQAAVVSIRKPDVYPDCAAVGVEMAYRR